MPGLKLQHDIQLADGFIHPPDIQQHAAIIRVRFQIIGVDLDSFLIVLFRLLLVKEGVVSEAKTERCLAISRIDFQGFFK
jgi:hypothetical protein